MGARRQSSSCHCQGEGSDSYRRMIPERPSPCAACPPGGATRYIPAACTLVFVLGLGSLGVTADVPKVEGVMARTPSSGESRNHRTYSTSVLSPASMWLLVNTKCSNSCCHCLLAICNKVIKKHDNLKT